MKYAIKSTLLVVVALASVSGAVLAQVAGSSTTLGISVTETSQIAAGWSVKRSILGKSVFNEKNDKVGKVEDLIISPEKNLTYLIIGAGGFIGLGQHDVAVPVSQIQERRGRLIMLGATKDAVKLLPEFNYTDERQRREQLVADTEREIAKAKTKIAELERSAASAEAEVKAKIDLQRTVLLKDVKEVENKLGEMNHAGVNRWREFEADIKERTSKLHAAIEAFVS